MMGPIMLIYSCCKKMMIFSNKSNFKYTEFSNYYLTNLAHKAKMSVKGHEKAEVIIVEVALLYGSAS
jgi:hypothetical protein